MNKIVRMACLVGLAVLMLQSPAAAEETPVYGDPVQGAPAGVTAFAWIEGMKTLSYHEGDGSWSSWLAKPGRGGIAALSLINLLPRAYEWKERYETLTLGLIETTAKLAAGDHAAMFDEDGLRLLAQGVVEMRAYLKEAREFENSGRIADLKDRAMATKLDDELASRWEKLVKAAGSGKGSSSGAGPDLGPSRMARVQSLMSFAKDFQENASKSGRDEAELNSLFDGSMQGGAVATPESLETSGNASRTQARAAATAMPEKKGFKINEVPSPVSAPEGQSEPGWLEQAKAYAQEHPYRAAGYALAGTGLLVAGGMIVAGLLGVGAAGTAAVGTAAVGTAAAGSAVVAPAAAACTAVVPYVAPVTAVTLYSAPVTAVAVAEASAYTAAITGIPFGMKAAVAALVASTGLVTWGLVDTYLDAPETPVAPIVAPIATPAPKPVPTPVRKVQGSAPAKPAATMSSAPVTAVSSFDVAACKAKGAATIAWGDKNVLGSASSSLWKVLSQKATNDKAVGGPELTADDWNFYLSQDQRCGFIAEYHARAAALKAK
ncbi:MAG: hypothetical protein WC943_01430 [Elusimicrobiota bacterium]|jgi:hypothetical protein